MTRNQAMIVLYALLAVLGFVIYLNKVEKKAPPKIQPPPAIIAPIVPVQPPPTYSLEDAIKSITKEELEKDLTFLASDELEGRMSGKKGNIKAFEWLKAEFEKLGCNVEMQKFGVSRVNPGPNNETGDDFSQNLIAWFPGHELKDEIVVVGAHGDHIGYGPSYSRQPNRREVHNGADDNASGTCAALEMARAISLVKDKLKRTWCFQIYSGEEMGLVGSRYYTQHPLLPKENPSIKNHVFMLNMDMVGYLQNRQYLYSYYVGDSSSRDIDGHINTLARKYPFAQRITSRNSGGSDHASFLRVGVPIVMLHTGMHAYYHTPDDDAKRINFAGLEDVSKYALELTWMVDQSEGKPTFNVDSLKNLSDNFDHGKTNFKE